MRAGSQGGEEEEVSGARLFAGGKQERYEACDTCEGGVMVLLL